MNILVVDDEYYIVKNIIETTDWSALGIEQAFPAYSASQAKRIFEGSQDIDILLTDIEMPRETGLQLVEWLHENDFHPIVLVLTGHQRFDYAQEALNLHIFSYLLKPIDPDQLMEKLTAAVQEVKKNAWYEKERLNMEEHLSTDTSDPISVIKDYIRSHLSDPDLGRTSITDKIHMNVLKRAYAQFYWQTWSNVNPALDIAHHNDIMQSIREKDLEKTQNYLKEDLADFCG